MLHSAITALLVAAGALSSSTAAADARIRIVGNLYFGCTGKQSPGTDTVFTPPWRSTVAAGGVNVPRVADSATFGNVPTAPVKEWWSVRFASTRVKLLKAWDRFSSS